MDEKSREAKKKKEPRRDWMIIIKLIIKICFIKKLHI